MKGSGQKKQGTKKIPQVPIVPIPFTLGKHRENILITTNNPSNPSKEQKINQAIELHLEGDISEAAKYYQHFINQGSNDCRVFSNYGVILKGLGQLQKAEICQRKAIELNPNYAEAHNNLGGILKDLGQLKEAELSTRKAIKLNPSLFNSYFLLSTIHTI